MKLTGLAARIAYAVLAGVVAFLIVFVLGVVVKKFEAEAGTKIMDFSALIGLLVGIVYFFARPNPSV
jgi:cation transporter-like permease